MGCSLHSGTGQPEHPCSCGAVASIGEKRRFLLTGTDGHQLIWLVSAKRVFDRLLLARLATDHTIPSTPAARLAACFRHRRYPRVRWACLGVAALRLRHVFRVLFLERPRYQFSIVDLALSADTTAIVLSVELILRCAWLPLEHWRVAAIGQRSCTATTRFRTCAFSGHYKSRVCSAWIVAVLCVVRVRCWREGVAAEILVAPNSAHPAAVETTKFFFFPVDHLCSVLWQTLTHSSCTPSNLDTRILPLVGAVQTPCVCPGRRGVRSCRNTTFVRAFSVAVQIFSCCRARFTSINDPARA